MKLGYEFFKTVVEVKMLWVGACQQGCVLDNANQREISQTKATYATEDATS